MEFFIVCMGASQLEAGKSGKVALRYYGMQWQLTVSGRSIMLGTLW